MLLRVLQRGTPRPALALRQLSTFQVPKSSQFRSSKRALLRFAGGAVVATAAAYSMGLTTVAAAAEDNENAMAYRVLGNTGLQVSVLSFGFWATYGAKDDIKDEQGVKVAKDCLRASRKAGVNLFDNAETYGSPQGAAETIMGEAIAQLAKEDPSLWRRSELILTTKIFWGGPGVNEKGLSVKHIREGLDASLRRLQVDYVDLVFCHRPDPFTPTETVVRAMSDVVRSGKATCWGTSEWSAAQLMEAMWIAKTMGLEPPQFEQPQYHMFHRERFEQEYAPLYSAPYNLGTTIWSPLASGLLTGKYNTSTPAGSRLDTPGYEWLKTRLDEWKANGSIDKVNQLQTLAEKELNCTLPQLALAWCLKNKNVSTILLGASRPEQVEENVKCLGVARRMTEEQLTTVEAILGNKPARYQGYGGAGQRAIASL